MQNINRQTDMQSDQYEVNQVVGVTAYLTRGTQCPGRARGYRRLAARALEISRQLCYGNVYNIWKSN